MKHAMKFIAQSVHHSPSGECLGGASLPWLGYRFYTSKVPEASSLYRSLLRIPSTGSPGCSRLGTLWHPSPFHWRRLSSITHTLGLPCKAHDVLLRTVFRSLRVRARLPCPQFYRACPICGLPETIAHCFFESQSSTPIGRILLHILHL